jgi:hypothetical protein
MGEDRRKILPQSAQKTQLAGFMLLQICRNLPTFFLEHS